MERSHARQTSVQHHRERMLVDERLMPPAGLKLRAFFLGQMRTWGCSKGYQVGHLRFDRDPAPDPQHPCAHGYIVTWSAVSSAELPETALPSEWWRLDRIEYAL